MGAASATQALPVAPRLSPGEQGLSTSASPLTADTSAIHGLGNAIDQAMTGNPAATAQLNAILSDPNAVQALTAPDGRTVRGAHDLPSRTPRESIVEAEIPSMEQLRALDQLTRQGEPQAPTMEQLIEQVRGATSPQQLQAPAAPQAQPIASPLATQPIQQFQVPGAQTQAPAVAQPQAQVQPQTPAQDPTQALLMQTLQTLQQQNQMLMQALTPAPEPQFDVRTLSAQDQIRWAAQTLLNEGAPRETITRDLAISRLKHEESAMLRAEFEAYRQQQDQQWASLSNHASNFRVQNELGSTLSAQLAPYDQTRVTPGLRGMIETIAKQHITAGAPVAQAVTSALDGVRHLLASAPAPQVQQPAPQQFHAPPTPAPNLAPAYAGMTPLQIQNAQRAMGAAALPGNGAGRYGPQMPDLNALDGLVLGLRH